jgi:hypothetical protein
MVSRVNYSSRWLCHGDEDARLCPLGFHGAGQVANEVLQQEEINVAPEILEQGKEARVPAQGRARGLSSRR